MSDSRTLPLRALAPAKINLGLFLGEVREDGRHELATVMQSISLADELTLAKAPAAAVHDEILCPGVPGPPERNMAAMALAAFRKATGWQAGPLRLSIVKRVPVAAGLGGGSGDAAATLRLAALASGRADESGLLELARGLGADVPAQVAPGRWLARGAGESLQALPDPGVPFGVLVLAVAGELSTAEVYAEADRLSLARGGPELEDRSRRLRDALCAGEQLPPSELVHNDLQKAARSLCPAIDQARSQARDQGAEEALLSGSGPTVLGLFAGRDGPARARRAAEALAAREPAPLLATPVAAAFGRAVSLPVRNNVGP
jgi:4-diphosphocytidyl-2-C-methyl-D-erythritol kinase